MHKLIHAKKLLERIDENVNYQVWVGFDGYVDTIVRPVCNFSLDGQRKYFSTMKEFGAYIQEKSGKSCSIELVQEVEKSGGNAFLFADMLAGLQVNVSCTGAFGYPKIEKVFQTCKDNLKIVSVAAPGHCTALEFGDGKLMLSNNEGIDKMNYQLLKERLSEDRLLTLAKDSDALAFMNWSEIQGSNDIWQGLLDNIFSKLEKRKKQWLFLDISDCSSRAQDDILCMLERIRLFSEYMNIILSLNENELQVIMKVLTENNLGAMNDARRIYEFCGLKYLFIHKRDCAIGMNEQNEYCVKTKFILEPKLSTGGGDNFNAGLLYGLLKQVDVETAMIFGNAASGYYLTNGHSASREQLLEYLDTWKQSVQ